MNTEVRYLSKSGNTKKVAEAISAAANCSAKPITENVNPDTDLLFVGGAVYAFGIDDELKAFISNLPADLKNAAVFSTTAVVESAYSRIKPLLEQKGIHVLSDEFHCRGAFKFVRKGRPNADDLARAEEFAREAVASVTQQSRG
ncbi:MAG: flavodoxin [Oscillospiraceae bacterium]|jgi:flavodoxin|nr:flavodoxin [Oscillospiraceae bacterium]